jgi:P4 family phage/plasmid primase-like protien
MSINKKNLSNNMIESKKNLYDFLNNNRHSGSSEKNFTHLTYGEFNGKFEIYENRSEFMDLYKKAIKSGNILNVVEKQNEYSCLVVDIDLSINIYDVEEQPNKLYTKKELKQMIMFYYESINNYIDLTNEEKENNYCFVLEKPLHEKGDKYSNGFHLIFPNICVKYDVRYLIRKFVVNKCKLICMFDYLNLKIEKIIDEQVVSKNGWFMYGSNKPSEEHKYELTYMYNYEETEDNLISYENDYSVDELIDLLSLRKEEYDEAYSNKIKINVDVDQEIHDLRNEGLKKSESKSNSYSYSDSDSDLYILPDKDLIRCLDSLDSSRWDDYDTWIKLCFLFINEGYDIKIFENYSKKSKHYKQNKNDSIINSTKVKNDGGIKTASLIHWVKEDGNEELANELSKKYKMAKIVDNLVSKLTELAEIEDFNINNKDMADLFYSLSPYKYIYNAKLGWYYYNEYNVLIQSEEKEPPFLIEDISTALQKWIVDIIKKIDIQKKGSDEQIKKYRKFYKTFGTKKFVSDCIVFLKSRYNNRDFDVIVDSKNKIIAFDDCLFDLNIKQFRNIEKDDYVSITTGYKINKKSDPDIRKQIKDLIYSCFENDELLNYYMITSALAIFGINHETFYIHTGRGRNGKGVLSNLLTNSIGKKYTVIGGNTFLTTKYVADRANPTLASCRGSRILVVREPDNGEQVSNLNLDFVKELTGGDDITGRHLFGQPITFKNNFTLMLQCNQLPKLPKIDDGITERIRIIHYPFKFSDEPVEDYERLRDNTLKELLSTRQFINEFMLMLIEYASNNVGKTINVPNAFKLHNKQYVDDNNTVKAFIDEHFEITTPNKDSKNKIKCSEFNKLYNVFAEEKLTPDKIQSQMVHNKFNRLINKGIYYYYGLVRKYNNDDDNDANNDLDL